MGWATHYLPKLQAGEKVQFRYKPHGKSMDGIIADDQLLTVEPITDLSTLQIDDIVLCTVNRYQMVHIIKAIGDNGQFLIGGSGRRINGWTNAIHGRIVMTP